MSCRSSRARGPFGLPLGPDRFLVAFGALIAVAQVLSGRTELRIPTLRLLLLTATAAYAVCSAIWVGNMSDKETVFALLDKLGLIPFLVFLLAPVIFATARDRRIFLVSLVGLAAYLGTTAAFETAGLRSLVFPRYIGDPSVGIHFGRTRGPFVQSVAEGLALYVCRRHRHVGGDGPLARAAHHGRRDRHAVPGRHRGDRDAQHLGRGRARHGRDDGDRAAAAPLARARGDGDRRRRRHEPAADPGPARPRRAHEAQRPLWDRLNSDRAAWSMFSDRPLLGHGWGTFRELSSPYYQIVPDYPLTFVDQAHNIVLSHIAEMGVVGGGLWLASLTLALLPTLLPGPCRSRRPVARRADRDLGRLARHGDARAARLRVPELILWTWAGIVWTRRDQAAVSSPARQRRTAPRESAMVMGPKYSV